jgi:PTH1 family peptidyl-tRNA hydrolase
MKPTLVIIGLGNPGTSHEHTRHNAGFLAIDRLSREYATGEWGQRDKFMSLTQEARVGAAPVLLVKPQTYMNRSGEAIGKIVEFYKLKPAEQVIVISDDVDLPLAEVRFRKNGGPGTHNGLRSIVDRIGESFPRIRIGLGLAPAGSDLAAWVLSAPSKEEMDALARCIEQIPGMVKEFVMGAFEGQGRG